MYDGPAVAFMPQGPEKPWSGPVVALDHIIWVPWPPFTYSLWHNRPAKLSYSVEKKRTKTLRHRGWK